MYKWEFADQMKCLLRYKSVSKIKERCMLLQIGLSADDDEILKKLAGEVRQDVIKRVS